jgi:hypothetical protein
MLDGDGVVVVVVGVVLVLLVALEEPLLAEELRDGALVAGACTVTVFVGGGVSFVFVGVFGAPGLRVAFTSETNSVLDAPEVRRLAV